MANNQYNMQGFYNQLMKHSPMLYKYQFVVEFIQGGSMNDGYGEQSFTLFNNSQEADQNFSYYAQSASLPKFSVQKAKAAFYGNEFRVPTVIQYEHDWSIKVLLEQDMIMYDKLRAWMDIISDLKNNGGGLKTIPNINMRILLLNSQHTEFTTSYVLTGVWPTNVGEIGLAYKQDDGEAKTIDLKIKYQYCYEDPNFDTKADPLNAQNVWR